MIDIKFLDLFSGIGLFRLGLEMAGFTCVGHCEIDKYANENYKLLHDVKGDEWFESNIKKVKGKDLPNCSVWTAGFPCQDISCSGKRKGLWGERSGLFFELIRMLHEKEKENYPRWIIIENVKGLLYSNRTKDFTTILYELAALGYNIEYALLNSKNFGVPQNRERVYIICDITGRSTGKIFPIGYCNPKNLKQIIGGSQGQRVYSINGISPTILSNGGGQGAITGLFLINSNEKYKIRRLTPKETFRLQGVPDEYFNKICFNCSDKQLYKQIGNAVTVPVVYEIGKKILEFIKNEKEGD